MTKLEERISDIPRMTSAFSLLAGLSKYADTAASAIMRGRMKNSDLSGFMMELEEAYPSIRTEIIESLKDDSDKARAALRMRELPAGKDVIRAALVLDQSHTFIQSLVSGDSIAAQMRLSALRLELEEVATNDQLDQERARTKQPVQKSGMYV